LPLQKSRSGTPIAPKKRTPKTKTPSGKVPQLSHAEWKAQLAALKESVSVSAEETVALTPAKNEDEDNTEGIGTSAENTE